MTAAIQIPAVATITAELPTRARFAPYGDLLGDAAGDAAAGAGNDPAGADPGVPVHALRGTSINAGTGRRYDNLMRVDLTRAGGQPCITLFRTAGAAHCAPFALSAFERHCLGSQTFVPLGASRCLAIVTLGDTKPDLDAIHAYVVEPGQAVTIRAGVWHHPLLSIGPAEVLVLERSAASADCEIYPLQPGRAVSLPAGFG